MNYVGTERWIVSLLEESFELLPSLWARRLACLQDTEWTLRDLVDHDERIAAHGDALALAGEDGAAMVAPGLTSDEVSVVLAAGYVMQLGRDDANLRRVFDTMKEAKGPTLEGLRLALCHGVSERTQPHLTTLVATAPNPVAAAAAEILAFGGQSVPVACVQAFFASPDVEVRRSAWRWARYATGAAGEAPSGLSWGKLFESGFADADDLTYAACLEAAAWMRFPGLLEHVRKQVQTAGAKVQRAALLMLGALGASSDLELVSMLGSKPDLGPQRFELLASYGHPQTVAILLQEMRNQDPKTAAAATRAFYELTGVDVTSQVRVPAEILEDPFEQEFVDEVQLPDLAAAEECWARLAKPFAAATRWSRGIDVSQNGSAPGLRQLSLRARREAILRSRAAGQWVGPYSALEQLTKYSS